MVQVCLRCLGVIHKHYMSLETSHHGTYYGARSPRPALWKQGCVFVWEKCPIGQEAKERQDAEDRYTDNCDADSSVCVDPSHQD